MLRAVGKAFNHALIAVGGGIKENQTGEKRDDTPYARSFPEHESFSSGMSKWVVKDRQLMEESTRE